MRQSNTFSLSFFKKSLLDLYLLYLRDNVKINQKPANILATGIRQLIEEQITNKLTFFETAEFVFEFGNAWDKRLKALALASKAGIRIGIIESFFEIDFATGEQTDKERKTFYNFFPTNHLHYGYTDLFAWKNMWGIRSNLTLSPTRETKLMIDLWSFQLRSPYDFWYRAGHEPMFQNIALYQNVISEEN